MQSIINFRIWIQTLKNPDLPDPQHCLRIISKTNFNFRYEQKKEGKTGKAIRITIKKEVGKMLDSLKMFNEAWMKKLGKSYGGTDRLFIDKVGSPLDVKNLYNTSDFKVT